MATYTLTDEDLKLWATKIATAAEAAGREAAQEWAIKQSHRAPACEGYKNLVVEPRYGVSTASLANNHGVVPHALNAPSGVTTTDGYFKSNEASVWSTSGSGIYRMLSGFVTYTKDGKVTINPGALRQYKFIAGEKSLKSAWQVFKAYRRELQRGKDSSIFL